ncbi:uncharacterized protein MYCFIDRAFT_213387 [Pseudocercospora fijiensis CIRAD86]|uniref:Uncharacterized protein n=1 Tax=Pseudocercospora fijiensis (strain CIRAD86) TaxID=383855 RepID=N1QBV7_PSEFD|nr:uncharacterized protein MYCFIDRAFT_213387 [Pseudocercospora fijiensis CIRAD86]EME88718.1 hypothetical protein MYCFIDRAFT_213387 [Pseudocercospora fijiensis CIRAD86]
MSASPARPPSGPNSVTPTTGGPPAPARKKPAVDIFHKKKKPAVRRPLQPGQRVVPPSTQNNGPPLHSFQQPINGTVRNVNPTVPAAAPSKEPEEGTYSEFPIVISKRQLEAGLRFHAMKLQSRIDDGEPVTVNPYDEHQFTRPLRLHRRFPGDKPEAADQSDAASGVDDKERELNNARRAERQAEREENQKLIAPTGGDPSKQIKKKQQKKVEEGRDESDPKRQKRSKLRYEEARPWHLEDFESKNVWVGSYEQALSERSIMLEVKDDGTFGMVPIEKWYRFQQANRVNTIPSDDVDKMMAKRIQPSRWAMKTHAVTDEAAREAHMKKMAMRRAKREDEDVARRSKDDGEFDADRDMLDVEMGDLNEFQDDDEGVLFQIEDDDDAKELEMRLFLEMRDAGLGGTGVKDEALDVEGQLRKEQLEKLEERKKQKRMRRQLRKREHQGQYSDSDDSDDPYADSSDSMDSEDEREEERKKEEAKKAAQVNGDKSGASTKGTNTPTGRPEKRDPSRLGASLKRPGSPDVSDLSGNESSRKKVKSLNGKPMAASSGAARSLSPDASKKGAGSGSDTDTSRKGRSGAPKIKLKNSPAATPSASRAASPARSPLSSTGFPTIDEVKAAIPIEGIDIKSLVQLFKLRVAGKTADFIKMVKLAGKQSTDPASKGKIVPK